MFWAYLWSRIHKILMDALGMHYISLYVLYISISEADRRSMGTERDARKSVTLDGSKINCKVCRVISG